MISAKAEITLSISIITTKDKDNRTFYGARLLRVWQRL